MRSVAPICVYHGTYPQCVNAKCGNYRVAPIASCLRLVRALTVEMHENWIEAIRYINMDLLKEHKKEALRKLDEAA